PGRVLALRPGPLCHSSLEARRLDRLRHLRGGLLRPTPHDPRAEALDRPDAGRVPRWLRGVVVYVQDGAARHAVASPTDGFVAWPSVGATTDPVDVLAAHCTRSKT